MRAAGTNRVCERYSTISSAACSYQLQVISLVDVQYDLPDGRQLFGPINGVIGRGITGLVGANGSGKSTLLAMMSGKILPTQGTITVSGRVGFLRQQVGDGNAATIAGLFGVSEALRAIRLVTRGEIDGDQWPEIDWTVPSRLDKALAQVGLDGMDADRSLGTLSGGQRMRASLAAASFGEPDLLILDEPTNDLDADGRKLVRDLLRSRRGDAIIASHDRALLRTVDRIAELSSGELRLYGGDWDFFVESREAENRRTANRLANARQAIDAADRREQLARERKQRRDAAGLRDARKGINSKVLLDAKKARAERSGGSGTRLRERIALKARTRLDEVQSSVRNEARLESKLASTGLHTTRTVLVFDDVTAGHDAERVVIAGLSFEIVGPARLRIDGPNGSGKSTVMRLANGDLEPMSGRVRRPVPSILLDQDVSMLARSATVLDNFLALNPDRDEAACRNLLAHFLFPADAVHRPVGALSGGETLRVALACVLGGSIVPPLMLLDEPTNHLDVTSVEAVEQGLADYDGALVVVSHDTDFIDALGLDRIIDLSR